MATTEQTGVTGTDLADVGNTLAESRPFGDCDYLHRCTWRRYEHRLEMLVGLVPSAEPLLVAVRSANAERRYRVIGDAVFRDAINCALGHHKLNIPHPSPEYFDVVMAEALRFLDEEAADTPLVRSFRSVTRLGNATYHGWFCSLDRDDSVFSEAFASLWDRVTHLRIKEPSYEEKQTLENAACLLEDLLPTLTRSALAHTQLVIIVEPPTESFTSVTFPDLPGALVLAPPALRTTWSAAEYLLHEAMHVKFIDLEHTHSLVRPGYRTSTSPRIHPAWHREKPDGSRSWPVKRCLTVMHVYVTLALFFSLVERHGRELEGAVGPLNDLDPALEARRSFDRARFLGRELRRHRAELGEAGTRFVAWLTETLDRFDPAPRPEDSDVHLLLDLYERETAELETALAELPPDAPIAGVVDDIITREAGLAAEALALLDSHSAAVTAPPGELPLAARFARARTSILESLRGVPLDSRAQSAWWSGDPGVLVRDLVEGSTDDLAKLRADLAAA